VTESREFDEACCVVVQYSARSVVKGPRTRSRTVDSTGRVSQWVWWARASDCLSVLSEP